MLISAALIVRDEADMLGDCLNALTALVDEVVVVDTGSTDETRQIAKGAGAQLFDIAVGSGSSRWMPTKGIIPVPVGNSMPC